MENKRANELVIKSNEIVEASYRLSLQEQRIILFMASKIQKDDEDFKPVKLSIDEFVTLLKLKGKSKHKEMEEIASKLRRRELIINKPNSKLRISWLSSEEYFYGQGYAELCFDPKLKPYLLQIKERFTKFQLRDVIRLKHLYSIRFYELLKQYESIGWRYFELDELKNILGIASDEYKLYAHFKDKVLKPVKKEFDLKYSKQELDFTFEYEEQKEGRRVAGLRFEILKPEIHCEPPDNEIEVNNAVQPQNTLEAELMALKLSNKQITTLIKKHPLDAIRRNIKLVQNKAANNELRNIPAFLFEAIEGDFASNQTQDYNPAQGSLISTANSCWAKCNGGCGAVWSNYKNNKDHECYYCKKFEAQRAS